MPIIVQDGALENMEPNNLFETVLHLFLPKHSIMFCYQEFHTLPAVVCYICLLPLGYILCVCLSVFLHMLCTEYQNMHSTSKPRTSWGSEDILDISSKGYLRVKT